MEQNILEVQKISKSFKDHVVLKDLSFTVRGGETFGLLGPNGAGKTTTMRMIMNILQPDEGEILFNGIKRQRLKGVHFGYLPEERGLYPRAKVLDVLVYFGTLNNLTMRKAEVEAIRYLDRLGIVEYTDAHINELSKGIQQKIQFIAAFLHDPDVLILDEPFTGLDPINQTVLYEILEEFRRKNKILILSTHLMDQAEKLCDHICLINQAQVVIDGSIESIRKRFREDAYFIEADAPIPILSEMEGIQIIEEGKNSYKFILENNTLKLSEIMKRIEQKARILRFEVFEPSLHDIFIRLIQEQAEVLK
ncbi:ABC transporter ATP-binding protein [Caldithrix abyssi]|uniref:ABC transporter related protein n=1 Tax=Caldithrix abyssi DSM 13497 TaxID=880073 RepID=H1XWD0_CALAY|nr:ATP-binding cassette domain-containing protein [Caldithrix abyssi]APF20805.1 ABC-2 type transport system ATP-binding protein [Caldithrix abyssi DSM 13497]EHO40712.1 ABC transporter related protein [Caldithrix abyssi DSM 13497]